MVLRFFGSVRGKEIQSATFNMLPQVISNAFHFKNIGCILENLLTSKSADHESQRQLPKTL